MRHATLADFAPKPRAEIPTLSAKETAATLRKLLKAAFPAVRFSVTSERGCTVNVNWTDGPTVARVEAITAGFQAGHFDGMTDSYEYDRNAFLLVDGEPYRPGVRFLFENRHCSPALVAKAARAVLAIRWVFKDDATEARAESLVAALEANPTRETANALWEGGRTIYPGDSQGVNAGRDLCDLVHRALSDRTTLHLGA